MRNRIKDLWSFGKVGVESHHTTFTTTTTTINKPQSDSEKMKLIKNPIPLFGKADVESH